MRRGKKLQTDAFLLGRVHLFLDGRHVFSLPAIEDGRLRAHADRAARRIHRRVAAANDGYAAAGGGRCPGGDSLQKRQRGNHAFQLGARQVDPGFLPRADGQEHRVELVIELLQRDFRTHTYAEVELHAQPADEVDLPRQHPFGQPVFGDGVAQHAAGLGLAFENADFMAEQRQVEGARQARRTGAGHGDALPGGGHLAGGKAAGDGFEIVGEQHRIGDEAVHFAHIDRGVGGLPAAAVVARVLADAAGGSRQGIIENHRFESVRHAALLHQIEEPRDVHMQRAAIFARRESQAVAHSGAAALGDHVVVKFVAEMAHAGEHRIGRTLSQPA